MTNENQLNVNQLVGFIFDQFFGTVCAHIGDDVLFHAKNVTMKLSFFIGIMALLVWACSPVKDVSKTSATLTQNSQDSTEYEILILDPRFDQWYLINYSQAKDYSNDYYRIKNLIAVGNWNDYYRKGRYSQVIDSSIDYWPNIDYGVEVNRKLYWYFKYVKNNYRISLFW